MDIQADISATIPPWRRWVMIALRWGIALVVLVGMSRRIWLEHDKLADYHQSPVVGWLAASGLSYLAGLTTCAVFWWMAMRDRGARPNWLTTLAAYYAGHLGKYVPGKGLVVVIRAGMMRDAGVGVATGAISCVHETLLMMATGALVASALLPAYEIPNRNYYVGLLVPLAAALGVLSLPPVTSRLGRFATKPFPNVVSVESHSCRWRTVSAGAAMIAGGWLLMGLSLCAVLASMRQWTALTEHFGLLPAVGLLTAVVALATVGGFVSLTPGGLGSREWILMETLGPVVGTDEAVIAAVLLRVIWVVAESAGTGLFWILDRQCKRHRAKTN